MSLKKELEEFIKSDARESLLRKDYNVFTPIAQALLNGYFEVSKGNTPVKFVRPTKVEFYYHEEYTKPENITSEELGKELTQLYNDTPIDEKLLIKDFIVYHRNTGKDTLVPLFKIGTLNNHQSGIDITFEHEIKVNDKEVYVRASALIRGFYVYDDINDCIEGKLLRNSENKTRYADDRSTYLYDHLYGTPTVFDGISVQWKDGEKTPNSLIIEPAARTNVPQYVPDEKWGKSGTSKDDDYAIKKPLQKFRQNGETLKYEKDNRKLQFYNPAFYR